jgi:putative N6-adenine-specific DNA methylase
VAESFGIFCVATPGLEQALAAEAVALGFSGAKAVPGGVEFSGQWADVWRANLCLRGATRVLVRLGAFRAMHLAQLDKRARQFAWQAHLRPGVAVRVEASCKSSRIYHAGAAAQRVATAIAALGTSPVRDDADVTVMVRIEDDLCTISLDTSGESLHKRGYKEDTAKAPLRETMASLFLHQCGYTGNEPLLDPMCGSGTFVIEAAEMALGLWPGRNRSFAFEQLASFDAARLQTLKSSAAATTPAAVQHMGFDRDAGAIRASTANAERAGVAAVTRFERQPISALKRPDGPPGLVMVNPPYGTRIGESKPLLALHAALGHTLRSQFSGWRVGLVTANKKLAYATALPFKPLQAPVNHGGLRVSLFQTDPLP